MIKRPVHLTHENASLFKGKGLVDVYHHRLPYPQETFDILLNLIQDDSRIVLDVGTGIGNLARPLTQHVHHVDAIDFSEAMIARGKTLVNGDAPNLQWIYGRVEDVIPDKEYSLIVGGDSMHWMDWDVIFSKFADRLSSNGIVAIVGRSEKQREWQDDLLPFIQKYSNYQNFERYDMIQLIQDMGHFELIGDTYTPYYSSKQSVDDYVASWHSRGGLSADAMSTEHIEDFDKQLRRLIEPYTQGGMLELQTHARVTWGRPLKKFA
jgi:SAM-dependent methyltransferase